MANQKPRDPQWPAVARNLSLLGQLGLQIAVPILTGVLGGGYLTRLTGSLIWQLLGVLVGVSAGLWGAFRLLWKILQETNNKPPD
ncbi:MAG: AtpZ/AtpI family protein [Firmicutes bacterium]|nr:AtpZ/AtpI family protein [Bacillota bacterium]